MSAVRLSKQPGFEAGDIHMLIGQVPQRDFYSTAGSLRRSEIVTESGDSTGHYVVHGGWGLVGAPVILTGPKAEELSKSVYDAKRRSLAMMSHKALLLSTAVIVFDPKISDWLKKNDPQAYEQCREALTLGWGGCSQL